MNQMTNINPDSQSPMLRVNNLTHRVSVETDTLTILQGVTLEINRGESVAIVGRSGSGKTTLLGLLAGLDTPTEGTVELDGSVISKLSEDVRAKLRAHRVGFVFQSFQLLPALTALENVMSPRQLSGGEQQRVAIARAFASEPLILFADEPTGNLDNRTGQAVSDLLMALNREQGTTLVMVTHDEHLAARCNRQFHIEAGVLTEPSAAQEMAH